MPRKFNSESIPQCCQTKHWHQEKPATSLPFWDVGRDKSEGLNRRIYRIQAQAYNSYHFPSFHAQTEGIPARFVWIRRCSFHQQLLPGTLTFLVYEDEEVSKECLPWSVLSNSVLSFARCVASEDLDRPNAWRHHESETNVQTEDVLQATHWMHSMTTHTRGIVWKIIESRSHGWRCCFHNSYHFPSFHAQTEGIPARFVWIRRCSFHQQLLPGTLTFLVYEDEEVSKECLP